MNYYLSRIKAKSRKRNLKFFQKNLKKRVRDTHVLCFPAEDCLEIFEVYDQMNIPRQNIVCLEKDSEVYEKIKSKNLGVQLFNEDWIDFADQENFLDFKFDIVSLDFQGYISTYINTIKFLTQGWVNDDFILYTNFVGARESLDLIDFAMARNNRYYSKIAIPKNPKDQIIPSHLLELSSYTYKKALEKFDPMELKQVEMELKESLQRMDEVELKKIQDNINLGFKFKAKIEKIEKSENIRNCLKEDIFKEFGDYLITESEFNLTKLKKEFIDFINFQIEKATNILNIDLTQTKVTIEFFKRMSEEDWIYFWKKFIMRQDILIEKCVLKKAIDKIIATYGAEVNFENKGFNLKYLFLMYFDFLRYDYFYSLERTDSYEYSNVGGVVMLSDLCSFKRVNLTAPMFRFLRNTNNCFERLKPLTCLKRAKNYDELKKVADNIDSYGSKVYADSIKKCVSREYIGSERELKKDDLKEIKQEIKEKDIITEEDFARYENQIIELNLPASEFKKEIDRLYRKFSKLIDKKKIG